MLKKLLNIKKRQKITRHLEVLQQLFRVFLQQIIIPINSRMSSRHCHQQSGCFGVNNVC